MAIVQDIEQTLRGAVAETLTELSSSIDDLTVSYHLFADRTLDYVEDEEEPHYVESRVWRCDLHLMERTPGGGRYITTTGTTPYGCTANAVTQPIVSLVKSLWEFALCSLMLSAGEVDVSMREIIREAEREG